MLISLERFKNCICPNNLVNVLHLVPFDPWPALSVTLEGFQPWVVKGASPASGWERVYSHLGPYLKGLMWGKGESVIPAHLRCPLTRWLKTLGAVRPLLLNSNSQNKEKCETLPSPQVWRPLWSTVSLKQLVRGEFHFSKKSPGQEPPLLVT